MVGNSEVRLRPAKVQPSLVSTVAVVDMLTKFGGRVSPDIPRGTGG